MTSAERISRALSLESQAITAAKRWPESPAIASNLRWAARYQRRKVARNLETQNV